MTTSHARRALVLIATGMVAGACTGPLVGICSSSVPSHLAMATSAFPIMFLTGFFWGAATSASSWQPEAPFYTGSEAYAPMRTHQK